MSYCPKCGVEVNSNAKKCPLCKFSLPYIDTNSSESFSDSFPNAINIYNKKVKEFKKILFSIIKAFCICSMFITLFCNFYISGKLTWSKYSTVCIVAAMFYFYLMLDLQWKFKNFIIGFGLNTFILILLLDIFDGKLSWSIKLGLPFIVMTICLLSICYEVFRIAKHKYFNVAGYTLIALSLYCIGIDGFVSLTLYNLFKLRWSLLVTIVLLPLGLVLIYIHHKLPVEYKIKLKKKLHI
ncbi:MULTISPECIES: DUF6320 domain-containing protein [Clostridium]|uniref:Zinc ribbon domain-containing protein n=1 Tax=Clostridium senegalense TaxID=1465809 RepID=A0A6M0H6K4_9CLOT|nr:MULTISPECIES: DUF6320 domain-containing protein [Clostridium]NEU05934.1 hypothetical protein [Clostridium senegalense]